MTRAVLFGLAAILASHARAIQAQAGTSLSGIVWDSAQEAPVIGATVRIAQLDKDVRTDTTGRFWLGAMSPGRYRLEIRRMGYVALDTSLSVSGEAVAIIRVVASPQPLGGIAVTAPATASDLMAGFEVRRKQGAGRFLTREDLDKAGDRQLTEVIKKLGGSIRIIRNQSEAYIATTLQQASGAMKPGCSVPVGGDVRGYMLECANMRGCLVQVFVDGMKIFGQGPDKNEIPPNLDEFLIKNLQGIEFYSSPSRTPAEFQTTTSQCGTLVIWTRQH